MKDIWMFVGFIFIRLGIPVIVLFSMSEIVRHRDLKRKPAGGA